MKSELFKKVHFIIKLVKKDLIDVKNKIILGFALIIVSSILTYIFPSLSVYIIDTILPEKQLPLLIYIILVSAVLYLIYEITIYYADTIFTTIKENIGNSLQLKIYDDLSNIDYEYFETIHNNERYSYLTKDVINIKNFFDQSIIKLIKHFIQVLVGAIFMFILLPVFTLILIFLFSFYLYFSYTKTDTIKKLEKEIIHLHGGLLKNLMAPIHNFFYFYIIDLFELFRKYIKTSQKEYLSKFLALFRQKIKINLFHNLLIKFSTLLIFLYCGYLIINDNFTLGKLVGYNFYFALFSSSLTVLLNFNLNLQASLISAERIKNLNSHSSKKDVVVNSLVPDKINSVKIENLSFVYPNAQNNFKLHNIDCSLNNEILFIIGRNGSGKSTLLKLLFGLYNTYKGKIYINGRCIKSNNLSELRKRIGYISQNSFFLDSAILDNIILNEPYNENRLNTVLELCGLQDFINSLDKKALTPIKANEVFLSSGFRQKVEIARALYREPIILIYDEGTTHLDPEALLEHMEILKKINHTGIPVIFITHQTHLLSYAHKVLVLNQGKPVYYGKVNKDFHNITKNILF